MKYSAVVLSALAAVVAAQPSFLNTAFSVVEGQPFELLFDGCDSGCTIELQTGESRNLKDVETLEADATGGSLTVDLGSRPSGNYNFKITDNATGESNYSAQFPYGTGAAVPTGDESTTSSSEPTSTEETTSETSTEAETETTPASETTSTEEETTVSTPGAETTGTEEPSSTGSNDENQTSATGSGSETSSTASVPDSGAAQLSSPIALVAGAIVAMIYFN